MHINYCFPTAIFSTMDEKLAEDLLPIAQKYLNDDYYLNKDITLYKTTWGSKAFQYPEFEEFRKYVSNLGKQFFAKQGYHNYPNEEFTTFFFINEMLDEQDHPIHAHPNHILSGVLYLQTPEGSAPIVFYDPKPRRKFISREIDFYTDSNRDSLTFEPKKGLLLMWESWLEHSVVRNTNKENGRISLVFNISSQIRR